MLDFVFYIILSLFPSFLLASSLRVLQIYLISVLFGLGIFSQSYYFECFIEVHINSVYHVSFALLAGQNNRELPYHSKCLFSLVQPITLNLTVLFTSVFSIMLSYRMFSRALSIIEIKLMDLLLLGSPFALSLKYKYDFSSFLVRQCLTSI